MAEEILRDLEVAAQIVLASPNLVSAQQRRTAENVFLQFHKTVSPYQLCQQILELSTTDYVLFETVNLLRTALIRESSNLSESDLSSLRQYFMNYVINRHTLAPYVRAKILEVIAVIIKRCGLVNRGEEKIQGLNEIISLIKNGDLPKQILGCSMLTAIMQEYAMSSKSSGLCLPLILHYREKTGFEDDYLQTIFELCIEMLSTLIEKDFDKSILPLLKHVLILAEDVLDWKHLYGDIRDFYNPHYYEEENDGILIPLTLSKNWKDIMQNSAMLDLFFTLYWKVRSNPQLAHHARNCLIRLSCFDNNVEHRDYPSKYLTDYLQRFVKLLSNIDIIDQEASAMINIIESTCYHYFSSTFFNYYFSSEKQALLADLFKPLWEQITKLTCLSIEGAAQEESMCVNDSLWGDALEYIFKLWPCFSNRWFPTELYEQSCIQIFNIYIQCHLSPPEGKRRSNGNNLSEEVIDDKENDKTKFRDQLQILGTFARQVPHHSVPLITRLLEDRIYKLCDNLNQLVCQNKSASPPASMIDLYEDLHWLIIITVHILGQDSDDGCITLPHELSQYSIEQIKNSNVDANRTLQFLISSENGQSEINDSIDLIDPVIRLIGNVFRLCAIEKTAISVNLQNMLSPELSSTIVWFLRKMCNIFIDPIEERYSKLSPTIMHVFGIDSFGSLWKMNFSLEKIIFNINAFQSELGIIEETIQLLINLTKMQKEAIRLLKPERVAYIIELAMKRRYDFPRILKRGLIQAVVQFNAAIQDTSVQQYYWSQSLELLQNRWKELILNNNFKSSYHEEEIKIQIIDLLESFIGAVQGGQTSILHSMNLYTLPVLAELPKLLFLYHNYPCIVQLILELFCEYAKYILFYLSKTDAAPVYDIYSEAIQTYVNCNRDRVTADQTAEEDTYHDILLFMQLFINLLDRECISSEDDKNCTSIETFLSLLDIIIPMITTNLLQFPSLCLRYYEMISLACHIIPTQIFKLSFSKKKVVEQLLATVVSGLYMFNLEVTIKCHDIILSLSRRIYNNRNDKELPKNEIMAPFLNLLLNSVLSHQIHSSLIPDIAEILYYLICSYQEQYFQYVQITLSNYTDENIVETLKFAFKSLIDGVDFDINVECELNDRNIFTTNFQNFLLDVQGLLII